MRGLIIATRQDKETKIDVNFYLNFRICMSLIPLQATCLPLIKVDTHFPLYIHFSRE
jgi:hypothetical protein